MPLLPFVFIAICVVIIFSTSNFLFHMAVPTNPIVFYRLKQCWGSITWWKTSRDPSAFSVVFDHWASISGECCQLKAMSGNMKNAYMPVYCKTCTCLILCWWISWCFCFFVVHVICQEREGFKGYRCQTLSEKIPVVGGHFGKWLISANFTCFLLTSTIRLILSDMDFVTKTFCTQSYSFHSDVSTSFTDIRDFPRCRCLFVDVE